MTGLTRNPRFYILLFSFSLSLIYFTYTQISFSGATKLIKLEQYFALSAVTYLYLALLAGPLCYTFRFFPYRSIYLKSRRALGVSAFYFGFLHFSITFFYLLGGIGGLSFLSGKYLLAISLSFTALLILFAMAATSFDAVIAKMTFRRWKILHRFVYLAGFLIVIHALLLGTHFSDLSALIPQIFFIALSFLLILESFRIDAFLKKRFASIPNFGIASSLVIGYLLISTIYSFLPQGSTLPIGIHTLHIKQAQDAQNDSSATNQSLTGDRTKRFNVSFEHQNIINPGIETPLSFRVYDASSGNPVKLFQKIYEKQLHLIIVDQTLTHFQHLHPKLSNETFSISTVFPEDSLYRLYLDFQPFGATEQQFAFTLPVGESVAAKPSFKPDINFTKKFDDYEVTIKKPTVLNSQEMAIGEQTISFVIKDAATQKPIINLKPYLGSYGHLVMINQNTFDYLHVHPASLVTGEKDQSFGPEVSFVPIGLYGPIKPGIYRVFAQFNPNNQLFTADFTVEVK